MAPPDTHDPTTGEGAQLALPISSPPGDVPDGREPLVLPISALNHFLYCPRRCALIHTEGVFPRNQFTEEGDLAHAHADDPGYRDRRGCRTVRAMPLFSDTLGLNGRADFVEFWPHDGGDEPRPVEVKRGRFRRFENDDVQLCAQALCLEEMLGCPVVRGSIYHVLSRRRRPVEFDAELRARTIETVGAARELLQSGVIPPPVYSPRCRGCSFEDDCLPKENDHAPGFARYMRSLFRPPEDDP